MIVLYCFGLNLTLLVETRHFVLAQRLKTLRQMDL